jgi:hypothetical protein
MKSRKVLNKYTNLELQYTKRLSVTGFSSGIKGLQLFIAAFFGGGGS